MDTFLVINPKKKLLLQFMVGQAIIWHRLTGLISIHNIKIRIHYVHHTVTKCGRRQVYSIANKEKGYKKHKHIKRKQSRTSTFGEDGVMQCRAYL